jgi:16S rRNA (guanine966-N2)-methyltransferase
MAVRVTGGRLRSRRLLRPPSGVRPTSDRVREAIFDRLGDVAGAAVLDLYAGIGSLGIEAASRGAERVVFVERDSRCRTVLQRNLAALGLDRGVRIAAGDAARVVRALGRRGERFDLVLVDPPYASGEAGRALEAVVAAGILARGATVVLESGRRHPVPVPAGLAPIDERRYGDTVVTRLSPVTDGAEAKSQPEPA